MSRRVPDVRPARFRGPGCFGMCLGAQTPNVDKIRYLGVTARQIPLPPSSPSPVASAPVVHSNPPLKCRDESSRRPTLLLVLRLRHSGQLPRVGIIQPVRELATPTRTTTPSKKRTRVKMKTFSPMYPPPPPTNRPAFRPQFFILLPAHPMIRPSHDM